MLHMSTITSTATSTDGRLALRLGRRGELETRGQVPIAARAVRGRPGWVHVVLVQTSAGPLGGDRIEVDVQVEAGASLQLTATAATLAYPASEHASVSFNCRIGDGGRLAWLAEPVILAAGCDLVSNVEIDLAERAAAVVRETIVLGRHGERAGRYRGTIRCDLGGRPLLRDHVRIVGTDPTTALLAMGDARVLSTLALLGVRPDVDARPDEFDLEREGRLLRVLADDTAKAATRRAQAERLYMAALGRGR